MTFAEGRHVNSLRFTGYARQTPTLKDGVWRGGIKTQKRPAKSQEADGETDCAVLSCVGIGGSGAAPGAVLLLPKNFRQNKRRTENT